MIKFYKFLVGYAKTGLGKELTLNLKPSNKILEIKNNLKETTEAKDLINMYGMPPLTFLPDITLCLKYLESNNTLSSKALLDIAKTLKLSRELKNYFFNIDNNSNTYNFELLPDLFINLYTNLQIESKIFSCIIDENEITDSASSKLSSIRRNKRKLAQEIKEKLNSIIHSSNYSKYIMEPIVTIRNDRFVIPVKIEYKDNIKGLAHDISASGNTIFIEPMSVFELNSKISNLKIEENIEIENILKNLSALLFPIYSNIGQNMYLIGKLDFIFAKANYSIDIDGNEPIINNEKQIKLIKAKHPLIDKKICVPIDISLGFDYSSLIITGPNTGGKTVTLKTVRSFNINGKKWTSHSSK